MRTNKIQISKNGIDTRLEKIGGMRKRENSSIRKKKLLLRSDAKNNDYYSAPKSPTIPISIKTMKRNVSSAMKKETLIPNIKTYGSSSKNETPNLQKCYDK